MNAAIPEKTPLLNRNADLARSYGDEADYLIALGIGSAALLHRLHNTFGVMVPNLVRLRSRLDHCANNGGAATYSAIQEMIDVIERSVRTSSELIYSLERTLRDQQPSLLDVNSVLYEVWDEISASKATCAVRRSLDLQAGIPPVYADPGLIAEVFRTVIENSFRAVSVGDGQIAIRSLYEPGTDVIQVEVQDNGSGIPQHILTKLFRGPVTSSGVNNGLGLWLARLMLSRLGGEIWVKHTQVGPRHHNSDHAPCSQCFNNECKAREIMISRIQVLVVDDMPDVRTTLSGLLADHGYDQTAGSEQDALAPFEGSS